MPSGPRVRANNVYGLTTDAPLTAGAVTFNSPGLANLPVVSSAHAVVTLDPLREFGEPEIVVVTSHTASATVATIIRGQYGTVARSHPVNTTWVHAPLDEDFIEIVANTAALPADPYGFQAVGQTDTDYVKFRNAANGAWVDALPLGAWVSYTPTLTQGVVVTKTVTYAKWTRFARTIHVEGFLSVTSGGTAGQPVLVGLPVAAAANVLTLVGSGFIFDVSAVLGYPGLAILNTSLTLSFRGTSSPSFSVLGSEIFTAALASPDEIYYYAKYEAAS